MLSCKDLSIDKQHENPPRYPSKTELRFFDESLMKPLGEVNLRITYGGKYPLLKFQVVSGSNKPLLSAENW